MVVPPSSPLALLQQRFAAAVETHRAGRLAEAERGYRRILHDHPDHADSLHLLGLLALQAGHPDDAYQLVSAALTQDGASFAYHATLADILRLQGRMDAAAGHFRLAALLRPDIADGWNNLGLALSALGRAGAAVVALRRGVALSPDFALAHNNLGMLLGDGASFRRAILCAPDLPEAYANLGTVGSAIVSLRRAVILRPQTAANWYAFAAGLADKAAEEKRLACRTALVCQPDYGRAHNLAGLLSVQQGDLTDAARRYRRALACEPDPSFYVNLADLAGDGGEISAMERLVADAHDDEARLPLHFALGKAYEDCGDSGKAFQHYQAGNALKRRTLDYDEERELSGMARTEQTFSAEFMARLSGRGDASDVPIFILGMPRSGSTLIEQILASHPGVHGGDERPDFPELLGAFDGTDYRALGAAYLRRCRALAPAAARVTDKLPGNFLHAGAIHLALPNARIIHSRRDPADTCLSCFTKLFRSEQAYTYELGELGRYYRAYARLMAHWRAVLPASVFVEVDYEAVIADPETQTRRLLAHCGLAWDPACLAFHETRREVRTASAVQVRRPIYRDSIGRWRRYGPLLAPLLSELEEA
jgi:tetratricopeptide (TPR) repeat protein